MDGSSPYPVDLAGEVAGLSTTLKGVIAQPLQGRGYSLMLSASGPSLAGLGSMLAADLPPGGPLQLAARVDDVDGAIRVHDITGMLGHTDLSGEVALHPGEPHWLIDADLASHHLDLQDFIVARADGDSALDDPRLFPAKPLPYRWIGKIDVIAKLAADELVRGDTTLQAAALEGAISAGRLTLDSLRFGYAGGQVALKGTGDVNPPVPLWTLQGSARRLAGGEALRRLLGLTMVSGGQADADFGLAADGRSLREIATSLDGNAGVTLVDGHIDDGLMRLLLTGLTQAASAGNRGGQLRCLTAIFDFTDGLGRSRTFVADTGGAVVVGNGDIDLRSETINMIFEPSAKDVSLAAVAVPVRVKRAARRIRASRPTRLESRPQSRVRRCPWRTRPSAWSVRRPCFRMRRSPPARRCPRARDEPGPGDAEHREAGGRPDPAGDDHDHAEEAGQEEAAVDHRSDPQSGRRRRQQHQLQHSLRRRQRARRVVLVEQLAQDQEDQARQMKRVYREVRVAPAGDGWCILLDARTLQTPARAPLLLPRRGLAEAIAAEWDAQTEKVVPVTMPLMQLAATAIDRTAVQRGQVIDEIVGYAQTDLVCYRAERPPELAARQSVIWQPLVDWVTLRFDAPLLVTTGVVPKAQPSGCHRGHPRGR